MSNDRRWNTARYFVETRHVAWVLFVATLVFGVFSYLAMPKRKDPFIKSRTAVAVCVWPGAEAQKMDERITRRIEDKISENDDVETVESTSRTGVSVVTVTLRESVKIEQIAKTFDDIDLRLRSIRDLPPGAYPIEFQKDFGDTAALMLTVASPLVRPVEIEIRAAAIERAIRATRLGTTEKRSTMVLAFPASVDAGPLHRVMASFVADLRQTGRASDVRILEGSGYIALDGVVSRPWDELRESYLADHLSAPLHPEIWRPAVIGDPSETRASLERVAGDAYSYRELDDFTSRIATELRALPSVAKVTRVGGLAERVYLDYSQERFAALGLSPSAMRDAILARNVPFAGGTVEAGARTVAIDPSGEYRSEQEIGDTIFAKTAKGSPAYIRDVAEVIRDYESPPSFTNFLTRRVGSEMVRSRAMTLAIQMRNGEQIARFSAEVDAALASMANVLPEDLTFQRTSDQAKQVDEKVSLFLTSLLETIVIVVVVGFLGFGEWRSALVLALSIPVTLAMTFIFMYACGIDIQQMSLVALILALGLLVDDPVVAGDAIRHELDAGKPRLLAAWLGPTKLARAILFATLTNIVAYLPFLLITGMVGNFIFSLPIVMTCSLVASRIVSMTFVPMLGYALLRPNQRAVAKTSSTKISPAMKTYRRFIAFAVRRRYLVLAVSTIVLVVGVVSARRLKSSFFPLDHAHLFTVDIFLPADAPLRATAVTAEAAEHVVREVAGELENSRRTKRDIVRSISTFVGGGGPRFWYSLAPQPRQPNYAQLVVDVVDEHDTMDVVVPLQRALASRVPGARFDVRQLENGKPVPFPVEIRFSGVHPAALRVQAERVKELLRKSPIADRIRDDWGENAFRVSVDVDPARAALAGASNIDVANTSAAGFVGMPLASLRDGDKAIPIVARLRHDERGSASDVADLYVVGSRGTKVPLGAMARVSYRYVTEKIQRRNRLPTVSVACFPTPGRLASEVMNEIRPGLERIASELPPDIRMEIGGTEKNVIKVRKESALVAITSLIAILLVLLVQFKHALKPLIVLAAIPYGGAGAVIAVVGMGSPFGFTAILGVISLVGVIVSHIIVLFEFIEEAREHGESLDNALLDAGTMRLRPVLVTVGATVLGLIPLVLHGGPLWEPLCYAQIGGLTIATAITLVLVPVLYAVFVLDLRWISWTSGNVSTPMREQTLVMPALPGPVRGALPDDGEAETVVYRPAGPPGKIGDHHRY